MNGVRLICLLSIAYLHLVTGSTTFKLASYYNDHMVLQMAPERASIWGYAEESAEIQVTLKGKIYKAITTHSSFSADAIWKVTLDPVPPSGPFTITISSISHGIHEVIELKDVLFGDVWVCSGQSNMAFEVKQAFNGTEELLKSYEYPNVRVFAVEQVESSVPFYDLQSVYLPWSRPSPEALGQNTATFTYFSAVCWFFGRDLYDHFEYPIGLISTNWGGTPDEAWSSPDALAKCNMTRQNYAQKLAEEHAYKYPHEFAQKETQEYAQKEGDSFHLWKTTFQGPAQHSVLWNAMIHPLLNMTIKGAIWYQGEANANAPNTYNCTFPAMIDDWRAKWYMGTGGLTNKQFPFGFVQLCTSNSVQPGLIGNYPILRWHQTADYGYVPNPRMENVFMAVSIDLPDPTSIYHPIHPRYKQDVGHRLALSARAVAYQEDYVTYSGPFPTKFAASNDSLAIQYDHGKSNIAIINSDGFEICCCPTGTSCDNWSPSTITDQQSPSILTLSHNCSTGSITQVRYLWREYPCTFKNCSIYSVENKLPGAPFILPLK
ncbi:sialate O-acetylesterase-like [Anneissia japonica]|uniref:sialate O-acetylesterase-like n=1 Tax=Anneissia japonica TaxID=1529436 RepID=UPI001425A488|nr:sialate O-acetylesterase-like [Anneissia japonica]